MTDAAMTLEAKHLSAQELYLELIHALDDTGNSLTDEAYIAIEEAAARIAGGAYVRNG